jgi:hypothetical protein
MASSISLSAGERRGFNVFCLLSSSSLSSPSLDKITVRPKGFSLLLSRDLSEAAAIFDLRQRKDEDLLYNKNCH